MDIRLLVYNICNKLNNNIDINFSLIINTNYIDNNNVNNVEFFLIPTQQRYTNSVYILHMFYNEYFRKSDVKKYYLVILY